MGLWLGQLLLVEQPLLPSVWLLAANHGAARAAQRPLTGACQPHCSAVCCGSSAP